MAEEQLTVDAAENPAEEQPAGPDWLALANQAYEGSTSYMDTNLRAQWERNMRQFKSLHPQGSKYLSDTWKLKSKFFRPKTRAAVRKAEASAAQAYFSTADVVEITATDDNEPRQLASSKLWKEVLDHRLTKSVPWFVITMGAYQETQVMGAVVSHQSWNHEKGVPDAELRPLENIRIDPGARWDDPINSSPYLIDEIPFYAYEVKERWPTAADGLPVTDGQLQAARNAGWDSTRLVRAGNRTDPKDGGQTGIKDFDIVWVRRVIMRRNGGDRIYYTLATTRLLSEPVPLEAAYPWLKGKKKRPYVMGICVIEAHQVMPASPVELSGQTQSEINSFVNDRRDMVRLVIEGKYWVRRNARVDTRSLTRGYPGAVTMMDNPAGQDPDVVMQQWREPGSSPYQEEDRLNLDHDDIMGGFSSSSVASNRKLNETVGGMNMISSALNAVADYTLKTFGETWYENVLNQILWMEQAHEADGVVLAMAGRKAQLIQRYGIDVIDDELLTQDLTLTINVGMGATNPINSIERFMLGLNSLSKAYGPEYVAQRTDFNEVASELFGKLGYKDGSRFMLNQEDPRVANLMQQIAELQAKVAQKRSPELDAAQAALARANVVKVLVEAFYGSIQGAELVAAMSEIAPIADSILQSAGYQQPTPPGVDPNIPTAPGGGATPRNVLPLRPNTSPQQPAIPRSATAGVTAGIEGGA